MNSNEYAAVAIPTLCRYEHFVRCIESLEKNTYAEHTHVYVSLDYPASPKHEDGYRKIREYLDNKESAFGKLEVIKQEKNLGAVPNITFIKTYVMDRYEKFIFTEDDNEFAPNFLEYINGVLDDNKDNDEFTAVSGFNYVFNTDDFSGNIYKSECYFAAFGYGAWSKKFRQMLNDMTVDWVVGLYKDSRFMSLLKAKAPNQYCNFVKSILGYTQSVIHGNELWKMDITYALYMQSHNKYMILPVESKVRNWGYDGSGENCDTSEYHEDQKITHRNFGTSCQKLDGSPNFDKAVMEEGLSAEQIQEKVNSFFEISESELKRTIFAYRLSRVIGIGTVKKLLSR